MILHGYLCDLVPFTKEFETRIVDWMNGPMSEWWGMDGLLSRAKQRQRMEEWRSQPDYGVNFVRYGIRAKDGAPIGQFGVFGINFTSRIGEVGAGIGDPGYWSGGFGSDAMLLMVDYAFQWLDLRRLYLTTMGNNHRAQRQVEKCGFQREAARRQLVYSKGKRHDFLWYGMLRDEWPGYEVMAERLDLRAKARARGYAVED